MKTNAQIEENRRKIEHMNKIIARLTATKPTDTGLVYGVPVRWLKRPHELNQADQQRLIEAIA